MGIKLISRRRGGGRRRRRGGGRGRQKEAKLFERPFFSQPQFRVVTTKVTFSGSEGLMILWVDTCVFDAVGVQIVYRYVGKLATAG
jgi:hypothetical protein